MGAINYKTSDFITLGYNTNNIDYDDDLYYLSVNEQFDCINAFIDKASFYYFHIVLKPGYYEGFTLDIEHNFSYCYDNYYEKLEALKEITRIKHFLFYIVNNFNVNIVYPGWCTGYGDYTETIEGISAAIEEMKSSVKNTPTYHILRVKGEY